MKINLSSELNNRTMTFYISILLTLSVYILINYTACSEKQMDSIDSIENTSGTESDMLFESSVFLDYDAIFDNESLNKPGFIKNNYSTGDVIILDKGNLCFYLFDRDGTFLRKVGRQGQGPGEMLDASSFQIDKSGSIYLLDLANRRFSLFANDGKFLNSHRVEGNFSISGIGVNYYFFVNENQGEKEVVFNFPGRGYYFTVYSLDGNILREIGEIQEYNTQNERVNAHFALGQPIIDNNDHHIIILDYLFEIRIYDRDGELKEIMNLDDILGTKEKQYMTDPSSEALNSKLMYVTSIQQLSTNDEQIIIVFNSSHLDGSTMIYRLSYDLKLIDKFKINIPKEIIENRSLLSFSVSKNKEVFVAVQNEAKILKFEMIK